MTDFKMIKKVYLNPHHKETGRTVHTVYGKPMSRPVELKIVDNDGDGYLLLYCDENGEEITDTWHETIEGAVSQAEWEFQVKSNEWCQ